MDEDVAPQVENGHIHEAVVPPSPSSRGPRRVNVLTPPTRILTTDPDLIYRKKTMKLFGYRTKRMESLKRYLGPIFLKKNEDPLVGKKGDIFVGIRGSMFTFDLWSHKYYRHIMKNSKLDDLQAEARRLAFRVESVVPVNGGESPVSRGRPKSVMNEGRGMEGGMVDSPTRNSVLAVSKSPSTRTRRWNHSEFLPAQMETQLTDENCSPVSRMNNHVGQTSAYESWIANRPTTSESRSKIGSREKARGPHFLQRSPPNFHGVRPRSVSGQKLRSQEERGVVSEFRIQINDVMTACDDVLSWNQTPVTRMRGLGQPRYIKTLRFGTPERDTAMKESHYKTTSTRPQTRMTMTGSTKAFRSSTPGWTKAQRDHPVWNVQPSFE